MGPVSVERDRGGRRGAGGESAGWGALGPGCDHGAYQGQVAVFRAVVPTTAAAVARVDFPIQNAIDAAALKQWKRAGRAPSSLCGDDEFIRRASIDINGTLPTAHEVKAFIANADPAKRAKLVDTLLERRSMRRISPSSGQTSCGTSERAARTCNRRRTTSTTGSGRAWRGTCHTINSCAGFWRPAVAPRPRRRFSGIASCARRVHLSTTRRRCSWGCVCSAPSATIIPSRNGASTTITASRRSSPGWAARRI